jgi:hypothetical protein
VKKMASNRKPVRGPTSPHLAMPIRLRPGPSPATIMEEGGRVVEDVG